MELLTRLWCSSLGKKYLMALSGVALFLFVLGHMVGNLQVFLGPEAINQYGHFLQSTPEILWPVRSVMFILVVLHLVTAVRVWLENRAARPQPYADYAPLAASYASRTMFVGGILIGLFIVYHLLHYTAQSTAVNLTGQDFAQFHDEAKRHDVFKMMVVGFSQPVVSLFYLVAVTALCLHLSHGAKAWLQSLGWQTEAWRRRVNVFAWVAATLLITGYASIPIAILLGFGKEAAK
jgi:succinate dehydrogenase / fumarate reductase, cytochrome b subunit